MLDVRCHWLVECKMHSLCCVNCSEAGLKLGCCGQTELLKGFTWEAQFSWQQRFGMLQADNN